MNYNIIFENERGFNIRYNIESLSTIIYDNGIDYHYHPENEKTIEDVEKMEYVTFDLTKEEREEINKKLVYIRFLKEQINECKLTGNDEDYIKIDVYEEILSKIEKE